MEDGLAVTEHQEKIAERYSQLVRHHVALNDAVFNAAANVKLTVLMADTGQFRVKPSVGGETFNFKNVRIGKKNQYIFVFEPSDEQLYTQMEVEIGKLGDHLPGFADFIIDLAVSQGDSGQTLKGAVEKIENVVEDIMKAEAKQARAAKITADTADYGDNALFGMF